RVAAEALGQFDGLVDRGPRWHSIIVQNLVDCKPQDILVYASHLRKWPFWRRLLDARVDLILMRDDAFDELLGECGYRLVQMAVLDVALEHLHGVVSRKIALVERLQSDGAGLPPCSRARLAWHRATRHPGCRR